MYVLQNGVKGFVVGNAESSDLPERLFLFSSPIFLDWLYKFVSNFCDSLFFLFQ